MLVSGVRIYDICMKRMRNMIIWKQQCLVSNRRRRRRRGKGCVRTHDRGKCRLKESVGKRKKKNKDLKSKSISVNAT